MQDRIRLRRNPPNVAVPNGYEDIFADASGSLVKKSPDGTKEGLNGGVVLRTAAEGGLGIPDTITITGITSPGGADPLNLPRSTDANGFPRWANGSGSGYWGMANDGAGAWVLAWFNGFYSYTATKTTDADSPVGLTGWVLTGDAVDQPVVVGSAATAGSFIGQRARIGDSSPYTWEKWDGTAWVAD